ncbi:MAG: YbaB/EbfC family nucleoid-associated protein [Thermomicrobia bacterium]|nr:YbaB/EbfC family nucleoid-associated protein [Thermomicrobia bacterium]
MQRQMQKIQHELGETLVEGQAGSGLVKVQVTALKQMRAVTIKPDVIDPDDLELLEDMIVAAVNDAMGKADELAQGKLGGLTGGLGIPGLLG